MTFAIRRADPAEAEAIAAAGRIAREAYVAGGLISPASGYGDLLADAESRAREAELWLAVDDRNGAVLGSVTFAAPDSAYAQVAQDGEGEFRMLTVEPQARGRGVGEALARHCVIRARELGLTALVLSSQPNMHAAHRIYERLGFVRTPELDWSPEPGVSLLTYRLPLDTVEAAGQPSPSPRR
jgi:ribosomal protein S18 acetylase RimI-like enzyme